VTVYAGPDERSFSKAYPNPWLLNDNPKLGVPQVFAVEEKQGDWLKVLLPVRPNGTTGWVKVSDVNVTTDPYRILVELGAHRITVYQNDNAILQEAVAIGAPATPTPPGKYYLRVLIKAPNPRTVYGPYAFGLSAHSEVLDTFNGGDAEVGIHGNNDASVLGKSVTHGCIRMSNDGVTRLSTLLPLGTPVEIVS
jgi:lipoprotein-anchoring transpeptidase ErfK/SrfK